MLGLLVSALLVVYAAGSPGEVAAPGPAGPLAAPSLEALVANVLPAPTGDYGLVVEVRPIADMCAAKARALESGRTLESLCSNNGLRA